MICELFLFIFILFYRSYRFLQIKVMCKSFRKIVSIKCDQNSDNPKHVISITITHTVIKYWHLFLRSFSSQSQSFSCYYYENWNLFCRMIGLLCDEFISYKSNVRQKFLHVEKIHMYKLRMIFALNGRNSKL